MIVNWILNRHSNEAYNFTAIAVNSCNVSNAKNYQLLILVNMNFFTKISALYGTGFNDLAVA